jgi:ATP-dependent Clp protease ATP-binding subunit ClpC
VSSWRVTGSLKWDALARFTYRARKVFQLANQEAHRLSHGWVGVDHLLLGLVKDDFGLASRVLRGRGCFLCPGRAEVEKAAAAAPQGVTPGSLPWDADIRRAVERAADQADQLRHPRAGTGHILLALLDGAAAAVVRVFAEATPEPGAIRDRVLAGLAETNWAAVEEFDGHGRFGACLEWGPSSSGAVAEPGAAPDGGADF